MDDTRQAKRLYGIVIQCFRRCVSEAVFRKPSIEANPHSEAHTHPVIWQIFVHLLPAMHRIVGLASTKITLGNAQHLATAVSTPA
jgi:hypothetical protein